MSKTNRTKDTDIIYNTLPYEKIAKYAEAIGAEEKSISFLTMKPDRYFYGICLGYVQMHYAIPYLDEKNRGYAIKLLADALYAKFQPGFEFTYESQKSSRSAERKKVFDEIDNHVRKMNVPFLKGNIDINFDPEAFKLQWGSHGHSLESWRRNAYEIFSAIRERADLSLQRNHVEIQNLTADLTKIRWDFKLMRSAAREVLEIANNPSFGYAPFKGNFEDRMLNDVNKEMEQFLYKDAAQLARSKGVPSASTRIPNVVPITRLTPIPSTERVTEGFLGPMGGGKNTSMRKLCKAKKTHDFILLDPDYLKLALAEKTIRDGRKMKDYGSRTHNEASSVMLAIWETLSYLTQKGHDLPNAITCTDYLNPQRLEGMFAGGGAVKIHYHGASTTVAKKSCDNRAKQLESRLISTEKVGESNHKSTSNLAGITKFRGSALWIPLYERPHPKKEPKYVGYIDMKTKEVIIEDLQGFLEIAKRANIAPKHLKRDDPRKFKPTPTLSQEGLIEAFLNRGLPIYIMKKLRPTDPEYVLSRGSEPDSTDNILEHIGDEPVTRHPAEILHLAKLMRCTPQQEKRKHHLISTEGRGNLRIY